VRSGVTTIARPGRPRAGLEPFDRGRVEGVGWSFSVEARARRHVPSSARARETEELAERQRRDRWDAAQLRAQGRSKEPRWSAHPVARRPRRRRGQDSSNELMGGRNRARGEPIQVMRPSDRGTESDRHPPSREHDHLERVVFFFFFGMPGDVSRRSCRCRSASGRKTTRHGAPRGCRIRFSSQWTGRMAVR